MYVQKVYLDFEYADTQFASLNGNIQVSLPVEGILN